jgi:ribosomal protein S27E
VDDAISSLTCEHCGSLLILEAPEREELCLADGRLEKPQQLAEVVVDYRVAAQRAEILHRYSDSEGNPPPEIFVQSRLRAFEKKLRGAVRVMESHQIHVPYWHVAGTVVQGILGRAHRELKVTRVRGFGVEHTVPGYDTRRANLRDRGLRLDQSLARALTTADLSPRRAFVPREPLPEQRYREIERWLNRDLDPSIEPIAKHGAFLFERWLLVYRPYWLARVVTDRGPEWILFDSGFATIAGYPSEPEVRSLLRLKDKDPLGQRSEAFHRVHVIPSRCPDCGHEQSVERGAVITVCPNCHLGLALTPSGLRITLYQHAHWGGSDLDAHYLPFWSCRFKATLGGGARVSDLAQYAKALLPHAPPGFALAGDRLFLPAFRLLGSEPGDALFKDLAEWLHKSPPEIDGSKVPLGGRARLRAATLTWDDARGLAPFVLVALHTSASAARLNTLALRRGVRDAKLDLDEPALVYVPFQAEGEGLTAGAGAVRVPSALVRDLAARSLRVSVFQASANLPEPKR